MPLASASLAALLLLGACSAVPDWADPTRIFDRDDGGASESLDAQRIPDETPLLSSVPDEPRPASSKAQRDKLAEDLAADRLAAIADKEQLRAASLEAAAAGGRQTAATPDSPRASVGANFTLRRPGGEPESAAAVPEAEGDAQLAAIIYFARGDAALNSEDRDVLRAIAALHEERGGRLRIVGHAAEEGAAPAGDAQSVGRQISVARAEGVAAALVDLGVAADRVIAEADSAAPAAASGDAARDRKVEIFLEN